MKPQWHQVLVRSLGLILNWTRLWLKQEMKYQNNIGQKNKILLILLGIFLWKKAKSKARQLASSNASAIEGQVSRKNGKKSENVQERQVGHILKEISATVKILTT